MIGDGSCPIEGCSRRARPGQLMCGRHWSLVPASERRVVATAYRRWLDGVGTLGELRAAQGDAIETAASNA